MWRYAMGLAPLPTAIGGMTSSGTRTTFTTPSPLIVAHPELLSTPPVGGGGWGEGEAKAADALGPDTGGVVSGAPLWPKLVAFGVGAVVGLAVVKFVLSR